MSIAVSVIAFVFIFGGSLAGMYVQRHLPAEHLNDSSRDSVKLGMGLMATMAALLLSLQLGAAWTSYQTKESELTDMAAKVILLDRVLTMYGTEAQPARDSLRAFVTQVVESVWPAERKQPTGSLTLPRDGGPLYKQILKLVPNTDEQRYAKSHALDIAFALGQSRWLMGAMNANSASLPVIVVLVSWLTLIFISFGLLASRNGTVFFTLFACAAAISGAIFLTLELYTPFTGVIRIHSEPLHYAITLLGN